MVIIEGIQYIGIYKEQGVYIAAADWVEQQPWKKTTHTTEPKSFTPINHAWVYVVVEWRPDLYPERNGTSYNNS